MWSEQMQNREKEVCEVKKEKLITFGNHNLFGAGEQCQMEWLQYHNCCTVQRVPLCRMVPLTLIASYS